MSGELLNLQVETRLAVSLFFAAAQDVSAADQAEIMGWMSGDEIARHDRIRHEPTRLCYLATRRLQRRTLGEILGVAPRELRFSVNDHGRPSLAASSRAASPTLAAIDFSIAHSRDLVVLAITETGRVGVDVEPITRELDHESVARRFFSDRECADLALLSEERRARRFLELWVLKEAWLKADGRGLSAGLDRVIFGFDSGGAPRLLATPDGDARQWQTELHQVGGHFLGLVHSPHHCI